MILSQQGKGNFNAPPRVACRKIMILQKLPAINGPSCLQNNSRIVPATNKLVLCLSAFFTRNMQVVRVRSRTTEQCNRPNYLKNGCEIRDMHSELEIPRCRLNVFCLYLLPVPVTFSTIRTK